MHQLSHEHVLHRVLGRVRTYDVARIAAQAQAHVPRMKPSALRKCTFAKERQSFSPDKSQNSKHVSLLSVVQLLRDVKSKPACSRPAHSFILLARLSVRFASNCLGAIERLLEHTDRRRPTHLFETIIREP